MKNVQIFVIVTFLTLSCAAVFAQPEEPALMAENMGANPFSENENRILQGLEEQKALAAKAIEDAQKAVEEANRLKKLNQKRKNEINSLTALIQEKDAEKDMELKRFEQTAEREFKVARTVSMMAWAIGIAAINLGLGIIAWVCWRSRRKPATYLDRLAEALNLKNSGEIKRVRFVQAQFQGYEIKVPVALLITGYWTTIISVKRKDGTSGQVFRQSYMDIKASVKGVVRNDSYHTKIEGFMLDQPPLITKVVVDQK